MAALLHPLTVESLALKTKTPTKRDAAYKEMISSEENFRIGYIPVQYLQEIEKMIKKELKKTREYNAEQRVELQMLKITISLAEDINASSKNLSRAMSAYQEYPNEHTRTELLNILDRHQTLLQHYSVAYHQTSLMATQPIYRALFKKLNALSEKMPSNSGKLQFRDRFSAPIQRQMRYGMLLEALLKHIPSEDKEYNFIHSLTTHAKAKSTNTNNEINAIIDLKTQVEKKERDTTLTPLFDSKDSALTGEVKSLYFKSKPYHLSSNQKDKNNYDEEVPLLKEKSRLLAPSL